MAKAATKVGKKKVFKEKEKGIVPVGVVHIQATFDNSQVSVTDVDGRVICWASAGSLGFKGSRKGTPFAAQQAGLRAGNLARDHGMKTVEVRVKGPGAG